MEKRFKELKMLLACIIAGVTFTGCSISDVQEEPETRQIKDIENEDTESKNNKEENKIDVDENDKEEETDGNVYEGSVSSHEVSFDATLKLLNDTECEYNEKYDLEQGSYHTYFYKGTYVDEGDYILVSYLDGLDEEGETNIQNIRVYLDGDSISDVQVVNEYTDLFEDIIGSYTCELESGEHAVIDINGIDDVKLKVDDVEYESYMYNDEDFGWVLSAYGNDEYYVRWVVEFSDGKFTYHDYDQVQNHEFVGTYLITGELGDLEMVVDEYGVASVNVKIDNKEYTFVGNVYGWEGNINAVYLSANVGEGKEYNIDLSFVVSSEDDEYDYWYEGTLTYTEKTVLNAG